MPRVDEGLIHAWLDGQLAPDEAKRVDELVANDAEWGAAAAEARGYVAGAARILGALDETRSTSGTSGTSARRASLFVAPWMRIAAGLVLAAGIGGVAWFRTPQGGPVTLQAPVVVNVPANAEPTNTLQKAPAPALAPLRDRAQKPAESKVAEAAPAKKVDSTGVASATGAASAKGAAPSRQLDERRADQALAAAKVAGASPLNISVREEAVTAPQTTVDPRLHGCWLVADASDSAIVLRFIAPVVTDVVIPGAGAGGRGAGRAGAPPTLPSPPASASLQTAFVHRMADSTFATEWLRGSATTRFTFTVRRDSLSGTSTVERPGVLPVTQPMTARRVICPQ